MPERLIVPTENRALVLKQLVPEDAEEFYSAHEANRESLFDEFNPNPLETYPDLESVEAWIARASRDTQLGLWVADEFAGYIDLRPDRFDDGVAEIGYWLDERQRGNGYATLAVRALTTHCERSHYHLYAGIVAGHTASMRVVEKAGYQRGQTYTKNGVDYQDFDYYTQLSKEWQEDEELRLR